MEAGLELREEFSWRANQYLFFIGEKIFPGDSLWESVGIYNKDFFQCI